MLEIQDLHVSVHGTPVLKGIDLKVEAGETFILFGPNGSGKTTLLMTLMGFSGYEVTRGKIIFKGHDITYAPMYERARLGIGMSFQRPPTIHGLPTGKMVELCGRGRKMDIPAMAKRVHFDTFLDRDVNAGFSGGEITRCKLLDGVPDCCSATLREQGRQRSTSGLIITHTGHILEYVNADRGQVMYHGKLCCEARPRVILDHIAQHGYQECLRCLAGDMFGKIAEAPLV